MKEIELVNSDKKAMVDDEDYQQVKAYEWHLTKEGFAGTYINGEEVLMHNFIVMMTQARKN